MYVPSKKLYIRKLSPVFTCLCVSFRETLPQSLVKYSNGSCYNSFEAVSIDEFMSYRIVITTLSHAAKFVK